MCVCVCVCVCVFLRVRARGVGTKSDAVFLHPFALSNHPMSIRHTIKRQACFDELGAFRVISRLFAFP